MRRNLVLQHKNNNLIHTLGLLVIMMTVTGMAAYMVAGSDGILLAVLACTIPFFFEQKTAALRLLRLRGARPISPATHPKLYKLVTMLGERADLPAVPRLFCEPSRIMNAYATGSREDPVIVLSEPLLQNLNLREIAGILGHETAHIKNNDLSVMALADSVQRITGFIAIFGQAVLVLALPLLISGLISISFFPILFIIFAPTLCLLLQMALSRTREFQADLIAVELTGDPMGLAQALHKLESYQKFFWRNLIVSPWRSESPSWLQTHPPTSQRISRLVTLIDGVIPPQLHGSPSRVIKYNPVVITKAAARYARRDLLR